MRDLDYLKLLALSYPNREKASAEIINLRSILSLPKGTEYFFSDVHGEYEAFSYLMRSASGVIYEKMKRALPDVPAKELKKLAQLVYYPEEQVKLFETQKEIPSFYKSAIEDLVKVASFVSSKYSRSKVHKKMPSSYAYVLDELIHTNDTDLNKKKYHEQILDGILEVGQEKQILIALAHLIQSCALDRVHLVGDIFDRGPRADKIMDELMQYKDIDIEWGNHDMNWIGASMGNLTCIANVLHIATLYNSFDVLESGYSINLRALSMYAETLYKDDPCERFKPHLLDTNVSDSVDPKLAAKMCKVITVIMFKLEGALISRHPEYHLEQRHLFSKIDLKFGTVEIRGKTYPLTDRNLPTYDPKHPYELNPDERNLMENLRYSFTHSEKLKKHIAFLFAYGGMYRISNGNLLYHACVPMNPDGTFEEVSTDRGPLKGKELFDYLDFRCREIYETKEEDVQKKENLTDLFWYLWCGPKSSLFGKDQITTFERIFVEDPSLYHEDYNPYYALAEKKETAEKILKEFGLDAEKGHIVNGHVPVLVNKGESPVKAEGKLFKIDGGLAKSYRPKTGIAGYTLISNSHYYAIAEHKNFVKGGDNVSSVRIVERFKERVYIKDTDTGKEIEKKIQDLKELILAYKTELIREKY